MDENTYSTDENIVLAYRTLKMAVAKEESSGECQDDGKPGNLADKMTRTRRKNTVTEMENLMMLVEMVKFQADGDVADKVCCEGISIAAIKQQLSIACQALKSTLVKADSRVEAREVAKRALVAISNLGPIECEVEPHLLTTFTDLTGGHVDIQVREDGKVVWVNRNGVCMFRNCGIESVDVYDCRPSARRDV